MNEGNRREIIIIVGSMALWRRQQALVRERYHTGFLLDESQGSTLERGSSYVPATDQ
jgi:hypothetical protein